MRDRVRGYVKGTIGIRPRGGQAKDMSDRQTCLSPRRHSWSRVRARKKGGGSGSDLGSGQGHG